MAKAGKEAAVDGADVIVIARTMPGADFVELFHVNKMIAAKVKRAVDGGDDDAISDAKKYQGEHGGQDAQKGLAINFIREHRAQGQGMEYRIKDRATGATLD